MANIEGKIYKEIVTNYGFTKKAVDNISKALKDECGQEELTEDNAQKVFDCIIEDLDGNIQDDYDSYRQGTHETNIKPDYSRHYESKSVASQMEDGTWIGWTYWYGGGKHSNPEELAWIETAYELTVVEEEVKVIKRTFTKV